MTQIFQVNAYNQHSHKPYRERDLYPQLAAVVEQSREAGPPIGVLTSDDRDSWAAVYHRLASENAESVDVLQRSIMVVCLDEAAGEREPWDVRNPLHMLVGGGNAQCAGNRWYDKIIQVIVSAEGDAGMVMEHAPIDGTVLVPLTDYCCTYILHGHSPSTYESASTRMFLLGRTEAIRSQSKESDAFCREYLGGNLNMAERDAMLRNAIAVHKEYANNVSARNDILITFGYRVPGGYGVCYSSQCNQFRFSICTRHCNKEASAVKFRDALHTTLQELGNNLVMLQKSKL
ncbi:hypothetical protein HPB48_005186 [Haemaphysalis longicornis]|uniref:Choline/carnitine acyltransferase domain-containing protein n=1 Tax=Haemaphysalis longicornis TaxID=44386 RepID=A0A9J6FFB5_HAELO|nr:hypothetical protein HPB48_005186 [Haemaphysalis longicornis]